MLNNILNIEGVSLIPKAQQRAINGGFIEDYCYLRITSSEGVQIVGGWTDDANGDCVTARMNGADRCQYDCAIDGFTADWLVY